MRKSTKKSPRESTKTMGSQLTALAGLICLVAMAGCAARSERGVSGAADGTQAGGAWVCEAGKTADDWDCIQSENIEPILSELEARKAQEAKEAQQITQKQAQELENRRNLEQPLPGPGPLGANAPDAPLDPLSTAIERLEEPGSFPSSTAPIPPTQPQIPQAELPQTELPQAELPPADPPQAAPPPPGDGQTSTSDTTNRAPAAAKNRPLTTAQKPVDQLARSQEPSYAEYAYRPKEPVRIIDLPEDFYAAQLLAVSTKAQIEDFVVANDLYNMSAARIERDGQILYVLLLGVYESKEIALKAVENMPSDVRDLNPWVRPIDGLQDSMTRADRLMTTASSN